MARPMPFRTPEVAAESNLTDVANAARFARDHHEHVRYAEALGWLTWDSARWRADETGEVQRLARETVRRIYVEAAEAEDSKRRGELAAWAKASDSRRGIENMLALAKSEPGIVVAARAFDRDPFKLNTLSGIVDLKTGDLQPHDPNANMTKLAPVFYREGRTCPRWLTFLDEIMGHNHELVEYLQRVAGYALTGDTSEQCLFLLYGTGANGKTTFLEVLRGILGDYARNASADTFMVRRGEGPRPDIARLRGARLVSTVETDDGRRLAESLVKVMTGGDTVTARHLYQAEFEFKPEFKLFIATNHKPVVKGTDHAIWRRIKLVPFTVTIPEAERLKNLASSLLKSEASGIPAWAVQGCLAWQKQGLDDPQAVTDATKTYQEEMDPIAQFIEERCVVQADARGRGLFDAYRAWAEANARHVMNSTSFSLKLQERGFVNGRDYKGRHFEGLALDGDA